MEQFRQIGEVVGSINALMVFQTDNAINQRQCSLLLDMFTSGYETVARHMKQNLRFEEKNTKWKIIEHPLKELLRVFREGEAYIKWCLETKDWWAKAVLLYQNSDCVEFHIHNLLSSMPVVIESIEMAGQISGSDPDEIQKRKFLYLSKYQRDFKDPKIFQWMFGEDYLVCQDFCSRLDTVSDEDRWLLEKKIRHMKDSGSKQERRLGSILLKYLNNSSDVTDEDKVLCPSSTLVGSKDYQVRRRLGNGSQYKEINWLGESFAMRHFFGDVAGLVPEISRELSLSHPNIMHVLCGFADEDKRECFLVMELMSKDLSGYIKEICGPRKRIPFSLSVAVDLMLQIARGMEYLHSKGIYHGELNPSNVLVKARNVVSSDGYLHAKISGFGDLSASISSLTSKTPTSNNNSNSNNSSNSLPFIWYAPEVLQDEFLTDPAKKRTEKADVYSFGMICFEVLTGKVPFEDAHLQGEKMSRNIRAGERPLFPFHAPKYITNLTKRCWHAEPSQRPSFSSICRILRYCKRFLVMNPEHGQLDAPMPPLDFGDIEAGVSGNGSLSRSNSCCNNDNGGGGNNGRRLVSVSRIPFEMFAYRVTERDKCSGNPRDITSESGSDGASTCGEENNASQLVEDPFTSPTERRVGLSLPSPETMMRKLSLSKKTLEIKTTKQPGTPRGRSVRPPHTPSGRSMRMNSETQLMLMSPKVRRTCGHVSDSELP